MGPWFGAAIFPTWFDRGMPQKAHLVPLEGVEWRRMVSRRREEAGTNPIGVHPAGPFPVVSRVVAPRGPRLS